MSPTAERPLHIVSARIGSPTVELGGPIGFDVTGYRVVMFDGRTATPDEVLTLEGRLSESSKRETGRFVAHFLGGLIGPDTSVGLFTPDGQRVDRLRAHGIERRPGLEFGPMGAGEWFRAGVPTVPPEMPMPEGPGEEAAEPEGR